MSGGWLSEECPPQPVESASHLPQKFVEASRKDEFTI